MKGVIKFNGDTPVLGDFPTSHDNIIVVMPNQDQLIAKDYESVKDSVIYSNLVGHYFLKSALQGKALEEHTVIKGTHLYNYTFSREYEAVSHLDLFSGNERLVNPKRILGAEDIKYSFGLEYETACGMIPEHLCFRDGLIPLRDGSITGVEYSSIVLKKEKGVNLILQELETLAQYTEFNKECALHMHLGGYPVRGSFVLTLYSLLCLLQNDFKRHCNEWIYSTAQYKNSRKDYCKKLPNFDSFRELYEYFVGLKWANTLRKPHPNDVDRTHKWNINTRYYSVNFINMLCYESPKTIEFRFLRPTFNFTKVYTWLLTFNAILKTAEDWTTKYGALGISPAARVCCKELNIPSYDMIRCEDIVKYALQKDVSDAVVECLNKIEISSRQQKAIGDFIGLNTSYEDKLLDPNIYIL